MTRRSVGAVLRAALPGRRPETPAEAWRAYLAEVEPVLSAELRVHRFAQPPLRAAPNAPGAPLSVWIEGSEAEAAQTQTALAGAGASPAAVLGGHLGDALASVRTDYVVLVRAGDRPDPLAVERLGQTVMLVPEAAVLTCDEDELTAAGARTGPHFRPGPSPDRWLACDDSGAMMVVARERAVEILGELSGGGGWRHELALILAGPRGEGHAHIPQLLCHRGHGPSPPLDTAAVTRALRRWEPAAQAQDSFGVRRVRRPLSSEPSVEVVVCFRDRPELLERCVSSVLANTDYERLGVALVDNGSTQGETESLIGRLLGDPRVRCLRDGRPFNFAALNNLAAETSAAEVLVLLNNDTEVVQSDWIEVLLEEALRPEVGAVAPLLLYPDGRVQHAGAALGLHGYAGHPFAGLSPSAATPFGYAEQGTRNWLAVSAACVMVERRKFAAVGGFDESFVVAGNDVDLCLRLTAAGYRSLCVPAARLLHDESRSRGTHIDPGDFAASQRSYGAFRTVGDPFYNPNLTLSHTDCRPRTPAEMTS